MEGYPQVKEMVQKAQWLEFVEKFDGFNKEVTKSFARAFDGIEVEIGDIKFIVTTSLIAKATKLSRVGEKWCKNMGIEGEEWKAFLKNPGMDITIFRKGTPSIALRGKWINLLLVIQKKFTYEGIFGCIFFYHICLMMYFLKQNEINLPYFLLNGLSKC